MNKFVLIIRTVLATITVTRLLTVIMIFLAVVCGIILMYGISYLLILATASIL